MGRWWHGFSLIEQMIALLMVAMTAVLLIRTNTTNAIIFQNASRLASAARLVSEFSAWVRRGGHLALGMPLDQALAQSSGTGPTSNACCLHLSCDHTASAWHYLSLWRARLRQVIPDARVMICLGDVDSGAATDWACDTHGSTLLMKLGWPITAQAPALVMPIGAE
jgi:type II secretory pathway pseudopilin PulG